MDKQIKLRTKNGYFLATESIDPYYPGIDVEFVSDNETGNEFSRPRVLFEYPAFEDGKLRVLIWDDKNSEDYTREIEFNI